jgi:glycosyltransferase involved in cell wall biosynthesis
MIATDVPGCREVVLHNQTGLLVPVDDATALATAIRDLADSVDLRQRFGTAARELAVNKFSSQAIAQQITELYRALCKPH